jgi:hypothetical protein
VTGAVADRPRSLDLLDSEAKGAWFEYLQTIRCERLRYEEVEPWAWTRLQQKLRAIDAKRSALRRKARS